jgi:hypothetical protein
MSTQFNGVPREGNRLFMEALLFNAFTNAPVPAALAFRVFVPEECTADLTAILVGGFVTSQSWSAVHVDWTGTNYTVHQCARMRSIAAEKEPWRMAAIESATARLMPEVYRVQGPGWFDFELTAGTAFTGPGVPYQVWAQAVIAPTVDMCDEDLDKVLMDAQLRITKGTL